MDKFVMVPVEPTEEMLGVWVEVTAKTISWKKGYKAMLAAAPAPAFDEEAERAAFENEFPLEFGLYWNAEGGCYAGHPNFWLWTHGLQVWLACAKRKAGVQ